MLLSKTYKYINSKGKTESTSRIMSTSKLAQANVPAKLIKKYDLASKESRSVVASAIENFLEDQEMRDFGMIDINAIQRLLKSDVTAYRIEKDTGVSRVTVGNLEDGKTDILKLQLKTAVKLSDYALTKLNEWEKTEMENTKEINKIVYERTDDDIITVYKNGEILGYIAQHENSEWDDIVNGADPIAEGWEDGVGNILSEDGWGEF